MESILTSFLNILINIGYYVKRIILAFIINILGIIMFFGTVDLPLDIKTALHYAMRNFWTYFLTYFLVTTDEDISSPSSSAFKKIGQIFLYISANCGYFMMIYHWDSICSFFQNIFPKYDTTWIADTLDKLNESVEALF